jgi:hypothetical protein
MLPEGQMWNASITNVRSRRNARIGMPQFLSTPFHLLPPFPLIPSPGSAGGGGGGASTPEC